MHDDDDSSSSSSSSSHTISNPLSVKGQWPINTLDGKGKYRKLGSYQEVWKGSPTLLDHKVSSFILSWIEEEGGGGIYITLALDPKIRPSCSSMASIQVSHGPYLSYWPTWHIPPPPPTHTHTHTPPSSIDSSELSVSVFSLPHYFMGNFFSHLKVHI